MFSRKVLYFFTWAYLVVIGGILIGPKGPIGPIFLENPVNYIMGGIGIALGLYHLVNEFRGSEQSVAG